MSGTSKRNSSRISSSSSSSARSPPSNPPSRDSEGAADENARRRQRRTRENEIGGDNLGDDQSPPEGGGGLSVVSRRGLSPSRQGRQPQPPADRNEVITQNVITNWSNYTMTEANQPQTQKLLDCRITGEANGLLYAHPFRGCFTTASAQFLCNIFATKADDVQALWEASGETQRLLQPSIKPEDEASLTAILNGWEKMALAILKRVFITGGNVKEDAVQHVKEKYASDFNVCPSKFVVTQSFLTDIMIYSQNQNLNEGQHREIVIHFKNVF